VKGGGIFGALTFKTVSLICTTILVMMVAVAMIGQARARSFGGTVAVVGGDSTNIVVFDMIPTFLDHATGNNKPANKAPAKASAKKN
jgi:hypothetical protein